MSYLQKILSWPPVSRVRRNHALEHATLQVLANKHKIRTAAGYSDTGGFWVIGTVATDDLQDAVSEAQVRLRSGEHQLAIHPNCGTNFVAAGAVAGSLAWLGMVGNPGGVRRNLERLPVLISLVTIGIILAQPLGPLLQRLFTVEPELGDLRVTEVARLQRPDVVMHRVRTVN